METLPSAGAEALHPSNKEEGREGGARERCELCYGGQRVKMCMSCFCSVSVK